MKKKVWILTLCLVLTAVFVFALVGCGDAKEEEPTTPTTIKLEMKPLSYQGSSQVISWEKVEHAYGYQLVVKSGDTVVQNVNLDAEIATYQLSFADTGSYQVSVKALGKDLYKDSAEVTKSIEYVKPEPPADEPVQLQAPQNVTYNNKAQQVRWDKVDNAQRYEVIINGRTYITEKTTFDMSTRSDFTYTLTVRALGDNQTYLNSEKSSITFTKETIIEKVALQQVKNLIVEEGDDANSKFISWKKNYAADGYELVINDQTYKLDGSDSYIYPFRGEPGHYEVKVRPIANEDNEKYVSGEFTILQGGFDIQQSQEEPPTPSVTYEEVMTNLNSKIEPALKSKFTKGIITLKGIQGINAESDTIYISYVRGTVESISTLTLTGIGNCNTVAELNTFVNQLNVTSDQISPQTVIMSQTDANALVNHALTNNHIECLEGYTFDDVKWCSATEINGSLTKVTIVTEDNQMVIFDLDILNRTLESYLQGQGVDLRNETVSVYSELSEKYQTQSTQP